MYTLVVSKTQGPPGVIRSSHSEQRRKDTSFSSIRRCARVCRGGEGARVKDHQSAPPLMDPKIKPQPFIQGEGRRKKMHLESTPLTETSHQRNTSKKKNSKKLLRTLNLGPSSSSLILRIYALQV